MSFRNQLYKDNNHESKLLAYQNDFLAIPCDHLKINSKRMKMYLFLFEYILLQFMPICNDQLLEMQYLNARIEIEKDVKSQSSIVNLFHPTILLTDSALINLKKQATSDLIFQRYIKDVINQANNTYLTFPISKYVLDGSDGILGTSKDALECILNLSLAYRWTGDEKYAKRAKNQLVAICNFPDWNPYHFLDTAVMSTAVGIGYDWLYIWLDQPTKTLIENALLNNGINAYLTEHAKNKWWLKSKINWNMCCNGGILIGALSVANIYPTKVHEIIQKTIANLPFGIQSFDPDGAWPEGTNYWKVAANYTMLTIEALKTSMGTDFGLSKTVGLSLAGDYPMYTVGPNLYPLNYDDTRVTLQKDINPRPSLFWLGKQFNNPAYINLEHKLLKTSSADARDVIFYSAPQQVPDTRKLDKSFAGIVPVTIFRSEWENTQSLFVGAKGGVNGIYQGHLDLGNFEMEAIGIRWAYDLGAENYELPGYFNNDIGGQRWTYYRLNSHSHNVPMLNNKDQLVTGHASIIDHSENGTDPYVLFDLTSAYDDNAVLVTREIRLINSRQAMQITDEFDLKNQVDIYWGMTTPATIRVLSNGEALLSKDGKTLKAKIVSPSGLNFYSESCYQPPPQNANIGFSRLMVKTNQTAGTITLKISLTPKY